jgi:hypothetical protein
MWDDADDAPTAKLIAIIKKREERLAEGKCPYCNTPIDDPNHGCRYAKNIREFHDLKGLLGLQSDEPTPGR